MSSSRALTGGTNDVNPQPLRVRLTPAGFAMTVAGSASSTAVVALPIPVQRLGNGGRAQVLEILKWQFDATITATVSQISNAALKLCLSTRSNGTTPPTMGCADPYTVDYVAMDAPNAKQSTIGDATTNLVPHYVSGVRDLTDGAGHGVLFGMDTLFVQATWIANAAAAGATATGDANLCIWYRWKNVGFSEYVGMVTSS
jgi:hypothetical protein